MSPNTGAVTLDGAQQMKMGMDPADGEYARVLCNDGALSAPVGIFVITFKEITQERQCSDVQPFYTCF